MKFVFFRKDNNVGKLADCEIHFTSGPLEGLKVVGFAVWQSRFGDGVNVTMPSKKYGQAPEEKTFNFFRVIDNESVMQDFKRQVAEAYERWSGSLS